MPNKQPVVLSGRVSLHRTKNVVKLLLLDWFGFKRRETFISLACVRPRS